MWCKNGPGELYIQLTEEESSASETWRGRNLESLESLIYIILWDKSNSAIYDSRNVFWVKRVKKKSICIIVEKLLR